ncbi:DUF1569 domain-containing protein [Solitalea lacus]|uniref:DUF1569 domain-containing protein n=1 Tax=Solitalea lacus TaxID=2911172 RepID=UPI001EDA0D7F|nr:DUF1569 domain-containing protein [Solitalea lacus]UKJ08875.1 DUF1569 domain-containing protein [Solitalea lacus]
MKTVLNKADNNEIIERINQLTAVTKPLWGIMNVAQMLAHCQAPMRVALETKSVKQSFVGFLLGGWAKRQFLGDKPFRKNLPTDKTFIVADERDFTKEKAKIIEMLTSFADQGSSSIIQSVHPFFGNMTADEWGMLLWKHLDHHLQQFGV